MVNDLTYRIAAVLARFLCEDRCGMHPDSVPCSTCIERSIPQSEAVIEALDMGKPCAANGCKVRRIAREGFRKYGENYGI